MFFDIPVVVQITAGRLARIRWCGVEQDSLKRMGAGSVPAEAVGRAVYAIPRAELSGKTANFLDKKRSTRTRHVCIHVAHSHICVLFRALSGAS